MIQKNRTLEGKNRTLGGEGGSKIIKNRRTSFMYVPLGMPINRSFQKTYKSFVEMSEFHFSFSGFFTCSFLSSVALVFSIVRF